MARSKSSRRKGGGGFGGGHRQQQQQQKGPKAVAKAIRAAIMSAHRGRGGMGRDMGDVCAEIKEIVERARVRIKATTLRDLLILVVRSECPHLPFANMPCRYA